MKRFRTPKYRLHKPSGLAVVTINGRDHYLGTYDSPESRNDFDKLINEWKSTGYSCTYGIQGKCTIAMLVNDYISHCERYYPRKANSEAVQVKLALRFLAPYFDEVAELFGPLKLKTIRETMVNSKVKNTGKPFTRQYINRLIDRTCRMFRWASENEMVPVTVYQALASVPGLKKGRTTAPEAPKVKPVSDEVIQRTKEFCSPVLSDMITLQEHTAMRPGEICVLTPSMFEQVAEEVWTADIPEHKCAWRGQERLVFFGPNCQPILERYLDRDPDAEFFSPSESEAWRNSQRTAQRKTAKNCGNRTGYSDRTRGKAARKKPPRSFYESTSYARAIRYACERAYPEPKDATPEEIIQWREKWWWSPNQLRHTAATKIRKLYGLEAAQILLGHRRADVTQVYAEVNREKGIAIAAKFG